MSNSNAKGKRGERELAEFVRAAGWEDARRGVQYQGGTDSPDVVGVPGVHLECKRAEKCHLYTWLQQAIGDAGANVPVVAHRQNGEPWVAILPLGHFLRIVKELEQRRKSDGAVF